MNIQKYNDRGNLYGQFKLQFKLENYLLKLSPNEIALITKLRCCNLEIWISSIITRYMFFFLISITFGNEHSKI
jgi:hypothetical protein